MVWFLYAMPLRYGNYAPAAILFSMPNYGGGGIMFVWLLPVCLGYYATMPNYGGYSGGYGDYILFLCYLELCQIIPLR